MHKEEDANILNVLTFFNVFNFLTPFNTSKSENRNVFEVFEVFAFSQCKHDSGFCNRERKLVAVAGDCTLLYLQVWFLHCAELGKYLEKSASSYNFESISYTDPNWITARQSIGFATRKEVHRAYLGWKTARVLILENTDFVPVGNAFSVRTNPVLHATEIGQVNTSHLCKPAA